MASQRSKRPITFDLAQAHFPPPSNEYFLRADGRIRGQSSEREVDGCPALGTAMVVLWVRKNPADRSRD